MNVPKVVEFSATPERVIKSLTFWSTSSWAVSRACKAAFTVELSGIVVPVNVPRLSALAATPDKVTKSSILASWSSKTSWTDSPIVPLIEGLVSISLAWSLVPIWEST